MVTEWLETQIGIMCAGERIDELRGWRGQLRIAPGTLNRRERSPLTAVRLRRPLSSRCLLRDTTLLRPGVD